MIFRRLLATPWPRPLNLLLCFRDESSGSRAMHGRTLAPLERPGKRVAASIRAARTFEVRCHTSATTNGRTASTASGVFLVEHDSAGNHLSPPRSFPRPLEGSLRDRLIHHP